MNSEPGNVTVIGPECFASADGSVICWQGVNYYREPDEDELAKVFVVLDGEMPTEVPGELRESEPPDAVKVRRVIHQCHADIDYYGQSDDPMSMGRVMGVREVLHVLGEGVKADPFDTPDPSRCPECGNTPDVCLCEDDEACTTCGQQMDDPQWCSRNPATGKGGHTHGGGVTGR